MAGKYFYACLSGLLYLMSVSHFANGQIAVNGSTCAAAGGSSGVMYTVSGPIQSTDSLTWQVSGGVIAGAGGTSLKGAVSSIGSQMRVIWNVNGKSGRVRVTDDRLGSNTLPVSVVSIASGITSSIAPIVPGSSMTITGGGPDQSCPAVYSYWWEAADSVNGPFVPVSGSKGQHLLLDSVLKKAYYRRVVCLNGENSYSNVVFVALAIVNL